MQAQAAHLPAHTCTVVSGTGWQRVLAPKIHGSLCYLLQPTNEALALAPWDSPLVVLGAADLPRRCLCEDLYKVT